MSDDDYISEMVKRGPIGRINLMWEVRKFDFFMRSRPRETGRLWVRLILRTSRVIVSLWH